MLLRRQRPVLPWGLLSAATDYDLESVEITPTLRLLDPFGIRATGSMGAGRAEAKGAASIGGISGSSNQEPRTQLT